MPRKWRCVLLARICCSLLCLSLFISGATSAQSEPGKAPLGASPNAIPMSDGKPSPDSPRKSLVTVQHLDKKQDRMRVAETTHFRILQVPEKPIGPAHFVAQV